MNSPKILAYYLPQYHPIPENDRWWGKGFTEWTNAAKAQPLFHGHYQTKIPADLGFYDLRVPETRIEQARLAAEYGIYGFCYWHYWFGDGKQLLERPINEVVTSGEPDFPFCLAWANESWKGFDHGLKDRKVLIEQRYGGEEDYAEHFYSLLPIFHYRRYIKRNGEPVFTIYFPQNIPDCKAFVDLWQNLAQKNDLPGIFFIGMSLNTDEYTLAAMQQHGMNAITTIRLEDFYGNLKHRFSFGQRIINKLTGNAPPSRAFEYKDTMRYFYNFMNANPSIYPTIISGWDHSPRTGSEGLIMYNYTPDLFKQHASQILSLIKGRGEGDDFVFLKSWNEWGEGNYMEPDLKFGHQFLQALKEAIDDFNK